MRWTEEDLAGWLKSTVPPLRNGVFQTAACVEPQETLYRKCVNGIWFQPRATIDEAAACEHVAVDAPYWWRGLKRNFAPVVVLLPGCDPDCIACRMRIEQGAKDLAGFAESSAIRDRLQGDRALRAMQLESLNVVAVA